MLNYELARVITQDRRRQIERAVRDRALRVAMVEGAAQLAAERQPEEPTRAVTLAASRSR
jgi:hypothetical protein